MNKRFPIRRICRIGILAALYFALDLISIRAGNLRITFTSVPVVISALLFGPLDAALVAFVGEFLNQMVTYGMSATIVLWLIPPMLRGIVVGIVAGRCRRTGRLLEQRTVLYFAVSFAASIVVTVANTVSIWLDSVIWGYYTFAYVFGTALLRTVTGLVTALVVTAITIPLARLLRKHVKM